ncbi:MAG: hypothetical protein ABI411_04045 [Tahibacter sp.]
MTRHLRGWFVLLGLVTSGAATSQVVQQVADVFTGLGEEGSSFVRSENGVVGGLTYFTLFDREHGQELWVTDGTSVNTHLFADLCPGECSSSPAGFFVNGTRLIFTANDGRHGRELWRYRSGDTAPTLIGDLNPGRADSAPAALRLSTIRIGNTVQQRIFFSAIDVLHGRELWRLADSASSSTATLELDIEPGPASSSPEVLGPTDSGFEQLVLATSSSVGREPHLLAYSAFTSPPTVSVLQDLVTSGGVFSGNVLGSKTYLVVTNSSAVSALRTELWVTEGTSATTQKLFAASQITSLTPNIALNREFFFANTAANGNEPYVTDGSVAGTLLLKDIRPGGDSSVTSGLHARAGAMLFEANNGSIGNELWRSDGTPAGTVLLKEIVSGTAGISGVNMIAAADGNMVYFANNDQLWKSDGSAAGSVLFRTFGSGLALRNLAATSGSSLLFSAFVAGEEPYASDGTSSGTVLLGNFVDGIGDANPSFLSTIGERVTFAANSDTHPIQMFSSSGSGTIPYFDAELDPIGYIGSKLLSWPAVDATFQLTDGTVAGTQTVPGMVIPGVFAGGPPFPCSVEMNGALYFSGVPDASSFNARELVRMDATLAAPVAVTALMSAGGSGFVDHCITSRNIATVNGRIVFAGALNFVATGVELMSTNGVDPPQLIGDLNPGANPSFPTLMTVLGNKLLFCANSAATGFELWITDGTAQGTHLVKDIEPGAGSSSPYGLVAAGGRVFFVATTLAEGSELWVSDGSTVGTQRVVDLFPGAGSALPQSGYSPIVAQGAHVYFSAFDGSAAPCALYRSNGNASGTRCALNQTLIDPFDRPVPTGDPLALPNGAVVFPAWRPSDGNEPRVVRNELLLPLAGANIAPGSSSSNPREFIATPRGVVYFSADDGTTGREMWKADLSEFIFQDGLE